MRQTIQPNNTLLVDGPASVCLVAGKVEVFGYPIKVNQHIVVRTGKRLPFYAEQAAEVEVLLGANAAVAEFGGNTVPASWSQPVQSALGIEKKPVVIAVIGASDSGKSSFCTYLFNKLIEAGGRVAVVDGDLGQSDIGPSATVGYGMASRHITQLHNLRMRNGFFVGVTSPATMQAKAIEAVKAMLTEVYPRGADYILVNTDGWISGAEAALYKIALLTAVQPDLIVGVQVQGELELLRGSLTAKPVMLIEASAALNPRSPEKRKVLREMTYARYLKKAKLQCYPLSQIKVEPRGSVPKKQEPDKGVLVGLYGGGAKFLGIGVLRAINVGRRVLKVQTSVTDKPMRLTFGKVLLNRKLQENQD
ncbi:MAG: Clp1/GlmU family protein [Candidatus Bathyarchaeota archaeon]|nr:Clp1/GlmU family protein [Candidatus Bathyarchaeota archaeon]